MSLEDDFHKHELEDKGLFIRLVISHENTEKSLKKIEGFIEEHNSIHNETVAPFITKVKALWGIVVWFLSPAFILAVLYAVFS